MGGIACLGAAVAVVSGTLAQAELQAVDLARTTISRQGMEQLLHKLPAVKLQSQRKFTTFHQAMMKERLRMENKQAGLGHQLTVADCTDGGSDAAATTTDTTTGTTTSNVTSTNRMTAFASIVTGILKRLLPSMLVVLGGGAAMNPLNGNTWSGWNSVYYALVTAATIGFGDVSPQTPAARLFAVVFLPLSVAAAGELLSSIAMALIQRRQQAAYRQQLQREMTMDHVQIMDANGDGTVSQDEYVQFMLVQMGRVTQDELKDLQFCSFKHWMQMGRVHWINAICNSYKSCAKRTYNGNSTKKKTAVVVNRSTGGWESE